MRRCALAMIILAVGCNGLPLVDAPIAPAIDVQVEDRRADAPIDAGHQFVAMVPLVPYILVLSHPWLEHSFEAEARKCVSSSGLFGRVTGVGSSADERNAAPLVLRVILEDTEYGVIRTCYCLGVFAYPLFVIGVPDGYSTSVARVRLECVDRTGRVIATGDASNREMGAKWMYETHFEPRQETIRTLEIALVDALADLDRDAIGVKR